MSNTNSPVIKREDYKAVKHMDRLAMTDYLRRIYMRGYRAGIKSVTDAAPAPSKEAPANKADAE